MENEILLLRLYCDTHIAKAASVQLRKRGVDVIRCEEENMAKAKDLEHLTHATSLGRAVVTQDTDFVGWDVQWKAKGKSHMGIIIIPPTLQGDAQISYTVTQLFDLHELIRLQVGTVEDDILNRVIWL